MDYFHQFLDYVREGFSHVNAIQGLIIALFAAFVMPRWGRLWFIALGAVVVHILADMMLPVIVNHAEFHLPPLTEQPFWHYVLALYLGYLVAIAFFFFVKKNVLRGGSH
jgi:hypothetical protein